jgi:hypothetical protein
MRDALPPRDRFSLEGLSDAGVVPHLAHHHHPKLGFDAVEEILPDAGEDSVTALLGRVQGQLSHLCFVYQAHLLCWILLVLDTANFLEAPERESVWLEDINTYTE